jgi:phosphoglycolate phosphatase
MSKLVLFDLDGTLIDSQKGIARCLRVALNAVDMEPPDAATLRRHIGPPLHELFANLGVPGPAVGDAVSAYRSEYSTTAMFDAELMPGIPKLLDLLASKNWTSAVATSKPEIFATQIVRHFELDSHFEFIAGATLDSARASKSDVIIYALENLKWKPGAVVMVGDRQEDVAGAEVAGLRSIAVSWGYGQQDEYAASSLLGIVDTTDELLEMLERSNTN